MDLQDTPEDAEFRSEVRKWLDANAPSELLAKLRKSGFGHSAFEPDEYVRHCREWQAKKSDAGWACPHWPEEYGGRGATPMERIIWARKRGLIEHSVASS